MNVTLASIKGAESGLRALASTKLPIKIAFKISKDLKAISSHLELLEEQRVSLVKQLGQDDGNGGLAIPPDKMPEFVKEMEELLSVEVTLELEKLDSSLLPDDLTIEPSQLSALAEFYLV